MFIATDKKAAIEADKKEDEDIMEIVKNRAARIKATSFAELEHVEKAWTKDANYDLNYSMTDLESRFVSLAMAGCELDLTPALPEQIRALVHKAKALDQRKLREKEEIQSKAAAEVEEQRRFVEQSAKLADKTATKSAAAKKAEKFMRKKSSGNV
jgi:hypothetical protein